MKFMTHVPGVAVHHRDKRFREPLSSAEWIDLTLAQCERLPAFVRVYSMEVDSSVQQSMPLVYAEIVIVAITLVGIAIEMGRRSKSF
jgi:hypothetical protein